MEHYDASIEIECIQNGHEAFTHIINKCCPLHTIIWPEIHKGFHCIWESWAPGPLRNEVSVKLYGLTSLQEKTALFHHFLWKDIHFCFHSIISLLNSTDLVWKVVEELAAGRSVLWHAMVLIDVLHFLNWYMFLLFRCSYSSCPPSHWGEGHSDWTSIRLVHFTLIVYSVLMLTFLWVGQWLFNTFPAASALHKIFSWLLLNNLYCLLFWHPKYCLANCQ